MAVPVLRRGARATSKLNGHGARGTGSGTLGLPSVPLPSSTSVKHASVDLIARDKD